MYSFIYSFIYCLGWLLSRAWSAMGPSERLAPHKLTAEDLALPAGLSEVRPMSNRFFKNIYFRWKIRNEHCVINRWASSTSYPSYWPFILSNRLINIEFSPIATFNLGHVRTWRNRPSDIQGASFLFIHLLCFVKDLIYSFFFFFFFFFFFLLFCFVFVFVPFLFLCLCLCVYFWTLKARFHKQQ